MPTGPAAHDRIRRLLLAVPNRRRVYEAICHRPGTHLRRIAKDLGLAIGSVEHHLRQLERHGLVRSHHEGRRRTYRADGVFAPEDAPLLHALGKPNWARILHLLAQTGGADAAAVADGLGMAQDNASYHLRRLRDRGLVEHLRVGRISLYAARSPERILVLDRMLRPVEPDGRLADATFVHLIARAATSREDTPGTLAGAWPLAWTA